MLFLTVSIKLLANECKNSSRNKQRKGEKYMSEVASVYIRLLKYNKYISKIIAEQLWSILNTLLDSKASILKLASTGLMQILYKALNKELKKDNEYKLLYQKAKISLYTYLGSEVSKEYLEKEYAENWITSAKEFFILIFKENYEANTPIQKLIKHCTLKSTAKVCSSILNTIRLLSECKNVEETELYFRIYYFILKKELGDNVEELEVSLINEISKNYKKTEITRQVLKQLNETYKELLNNILR